MPTIDVTVKNKIAACEKRYVISANSNYFVEFDFDEEWTDNVKTARFFFDSSCVDMIFTGNKVPVPKIPACTTFGVGVFTDALASTTAEIGCIISAADEESNNAFNFTQSQYEQMVALLNDAELRQIKQISRTGSIVTVEYNNNTSDSFPLNDGVGVQNAEIDSLGNLTMLLTDGSQIHCGNVSSKKGDWMLLNSVTLTENVDEITISQKTDGTPFSVDELTVRAEFKSCNETTADTDVIFREYRLPKTALNTQGVFESALRTNSNVTKVCYMKSAGNGNCFSVQAPSTFGANAKVMISNAIGSSANAIKGITLSAAANTGRIGKGTTITIYGRI